MHHRRSSPPPSARLLAACRQVLRPLSRALGGRRTLPVLVVVLAVAGVVLVVPLMAAGRGGLSTAESGVSTSAGTSAPRGGVVTMGVDGEPPAPGTTPVPGAPESSTGAPPDAAPAGSPPAGPTAGSATAGGSPADGSTAGSAAEGGSTAGGPAGTEAAPDTTAAGSSTAAGPSTAAGSSSPRSSSGGSSSPGSSSAGSSPAGSSAGSSAAAASSAGSSPARSSSAGSPSAGTPSAPAPTQTSPQAAPAARTSAPAAPAASGTEAAVLDLVNRARAEAGCGAVSADASLAAVARAHSADMRDRGYFSHDTPEGLSPFDRAEAAGLTNARAENIAYGQRDAAAVMDAWMNSPGHRANILNCSLSTLGVGVAEGPGGPWWTQLFGA